MGLSPLHLRFLLFPFLLAGSFASLYRPPRPLLSYHNGALLDDDISVSILWYGKFSSAKKSVVADFLLSLTPHHPYSTAAAPSVSQWWSTVDRYLRLAGRKKTRVLLDRQAIDSACSMGKRLTRAQVKKLAWGLAGDRIGGISLVLTAADVAVEGFCLGDCGLHGAMADGVGPAYAWVGDASQQCPGECAWPFHQPVYGPQAPPLVSPNGDVGADGMVINVAKMIAGAVTNPLGNGFFMGEPGAGVEVAAACPGVYGQRAYPGYPGELKMDPGSGASYNVEGLAGRKFLVPALLDPETFACVTTV